jgi:fimbrial chaperone protein
MKWISSLLLILFFFNSYAFKLSPMSQSLTPGDGEQHMLFNVQNKSSSPIAVELTIAQRNMDEWGKERHPEVEDQFIIFPDQMIIKAGQKRTVKVTYLGDKNISVEKAYRLIAEQLPIEVANQDKKKRTNIKILLKYVAAVYVSPVKGESELELLTSSVDLDAESFVVKVKNKGALHHILNKHHVELNSAGNKVLLEKKALKGMFGENLLAGKVRNFRIKTPKSLRGKRKVSLRLVEISK